MKINPTQRSKKKRSSRDKELTLTEKITRTIAIIVAFATVYYFFIKILFL